MKDTFTIVFSLVGVLVLIMITYYGARWLNKRVHVPGNSTIKILERVNIGPEKALMIISIGEKNMLLGVSQQHIEKLSDLDKADIEKLIVEKTSSVKDNFALQFLNALTSRKQKEGGGEKNGNKN